MPSTLPPSTAPAAATPAPAVPLSTVEDRRAQLEDRLTEVTCDECAALVRVRKTSLAQTTVQWSVPAVGRCTEFASQARPSALVGTCLALRDSIDRAVREGRLAAG